MGAATCGSWQKFRRHRTGRGDFSLGEDAEILKLSDLHGVAGRIEADDVLWAAVLVATGDQFRVDDLLAGKHPKPIGLFGVGGFHLRSGSVGFAFPVIPPPPAASPPT